MAGGSDDLYTACTLSPDTKTIRVLHMKPGDENDQIQGSLRHLELATEPPPQYECVSYVWGSPESVRSATINDQCVMIQKNLHDALRYIRSKTKTVIVWADAICINQSNIEEKSHQVAMMAEIYRQCSKVYLWLGLPDPGSLTGNPFEFLEHFRRGGHYYDLPGFRLDNLTGRWTWKENEACSNVLKDLLQVVESPWWTRAWTVQECLLPRDNLVVFGTWTTKMNYIYEAYRLKISHENSQCCNEAVKAFSPHLQFCIEQWLWHVTQLQSFRAVLQEIKPRSWFFQAIRAFSNRKSLDPRDRIYSMLSLATHPSYQGFTPDYQEDVSTVYTDIFTRMVRETDGSFSCFMGGGFGSSMPGLPSWVRDFSQARPLIDIGIEQLRIEYLTLYQASLERPFQPVWNENRELHYKGTYAETVKAVGSQVSTNRVSREVFSSWLGLCTGAIASSDPRVLRITFLRIICGDVCRTLDRDSHFRRAKETDFHEDTWDRLMAGDISVFDARAYGSGLNFGVRGRCIFTTYSGKMGFRPPKTLPGDEVWVMWGVRVPFVVRPSEPANAGCAGKHFFLGDCFLHGIMDGELGEQEISMARPIIMI